MRHDIVQNRAHGVDLLPRVPSRRLHHPARGRVRRNERGGGGLPGRRRRQTGAGLRRRAPPQGSVEVKAGRAEGRDDVLKTAAKTRGNARADSVAVDAAVDSAPGGEGFASSGAYALDSIDRNRALDMLRAVEAREIAIRRKWGLRGADRGLVSADGATLASSSSYADSMTAPSSPHADVVARARSSIREIEADTAHVSRRISADVRSLRYAGAAALEATTDADAVARVWEARSRYVQWRAAADDAVLVRDGEGDAFDPSEVNEEVAERLLDGLLTDVAIELTGACDDATAAVLRQEFTSSAEREAEDVSAGGYDAGSNLIDDDVVGAAVERAYLRGGGWKPDE